MIPVIGLCEPITRERLEEIGNGPWTLEQEEEIIKGHMRYVLKIVSKFKRIKPFLEDALMSEAFLQLVKSVKRPKVREGKTITDYISITIDSALQNVLATSNSTVSRRTYKKIEDKSSIPILIFEPMVTDFAVFGDTINEIKEEIQACVKRGFEKQVIELRAMEMTDREISELLKTSHVTVMRARKEVYDRFLERHNNET